MADLPISGRPLFDTLVGTDLIYVVKNGVTGRMKLSDLQKLVGGSGGSSASAVNLLRNPKDVTIFSDWFIYDAANAGTKVLDKQIVQFPNVSTEKSIYETFPTAKPLAVGTYTWGLTVTRVAGTGTGFIRAAVFTEGDSKHYNADFQAISDGVPYRTYLTVNITSASGIPHFAIDCITDGGKFNISNLTLVAGSTDNKDAT